MKLVRDNGLTIVLVLASLLTIGGMFATGWVVHNDELVQHHDKPLTLLSYATSGHFLSALFENWESEFFADVGLCGVDGIPLPARVRRIQGSR